MSVRDVPNDQGAGSRSLRAPNPVHGPAEVHFSLPAAGQVTLSVFDLGGRQVRRLLAARVDAGPHVTSWDLTDGGGRSVASGMYFVRIDFAGRILTRRLLVSR